MFRAGKAVRISPNDIVTDDLDHVLKMSAVRSTYTRSDVYSSTAFDWQVNHVFSERNEARHNELRAKLASGVRIATRHIFEMLTFSVFWKGESISGA
jgi:hypothetical protein